MKTDIRAYELNRMCVSVSTQTHMHSNTHT